MSLTDRKNILKFAGIVIFFQAFAYTFYIACKLPIIKEGQQVKKNTIRTKHFVENSHCDWQWHALAFKKTHTT